VRDAMFAFLAAFLDLDLLGWECSIMRQTNTHAVSLLKSSGPARGPQRVSMRGGDGVPWPAAGADFLDFSFFAIFYLFSWEFCVLAAMLSRLATACRRC